jgi:hypothetical protein
MKSVRSFYLRLQLRLVSGAFFLLVAIRGFAGIPSPDNIIFQTPSQADAVPRAAATLGGSGQAGLALIRELQVWRGRALDAEGKMSAQQQAGSSRSSGQASQASAVKFNVVGSLDAERVVLVSCGKSSGVFEGALISIGAGVKAKVVESRSGVSAAVIENGFQGKVSLLEGQPAQLVLVR